MNHILSRIIIGVFITLGGGFLIGVGIFNEPWAFLYGVPIFVIGIIILFNKKEDTIEQIKKKN